MISLRMLKLGGMAILSAELIIHISEAIGAMSSVPFISIMLREWIFSYIIFARKNRDEDVSPWASMIASLPYRPNLEFDIKPIIIRLMCPIDEYAISSFKSVCRRHAILVISPPVSAVDKIRLQVFKL